MVMRLFRNQMKSNKRGNTSALKCNFRRENWIRPKSHGESKWSLDLSWLCLCFFITYSKGLAVFQHDDGFELCSLRFLKGFFFKKKKKTWLFFFFFLYSKSVWKFWPAASPPCSSALLSLHSPRSQDPISLAPGFLLASAPHCSNPPPPPIHFTLPPPHSLFSPSLPPLLVFEREFRPTQKV
jgi:hypothetical protein